MSLTLNQAWSMYFTLNQIPDNNNLCSAKGNQ